MKKIILYFNTSNLPNNNLNNKFILKKSKKISKIKVKKKKNH